MQKDLTPLVAAALLVSLAAAAISMLTLLRQRDLGQRLADVEQRVAAMREALLEQATGKSLDSLLQEFNAPPAAPDEAQARKNLDALSLSLRQYASRELTDAQQSTAEDVRAAIEQRNADMQPEYTISIPLEHIEATKRQPQVEITVSRERAAAYGLTPAAIEEALRTAIAAGQTYLGRVIVTTSDGRSVRLEDAATIRFVGPRPEPSEEPRAPAPVEKDQP